MLYLSAYFAYKIREAVYFKSRQNSERHKDLLADNPRRKWDYVVLQSWQDEYPDLTFILTSALPF